jgi:hypothetical protein
MLSRTVRSRTSSHKGPGFGVWEAAKNVATQGPMRNRVRSIAQRLTKRQESSGRWKAKRLAEWAKLRRPKS